MARRYANEHSYRISGRGESRSDRGMIYDFKDDEDTRHIAN